jgi:hypothetical protein
MVNTSNSHLDTFLHDAPEYSTTVEVITPQKTLPILKYYFYSPLQFFHFFCSADQFNLILIISELQFFSNCPTACKFFEVTLFSLEVLLKGRLSLEEAS